MKKAEQLFEQYLKEKGMPQGKDEIVDLIEWLISKHVLKLEVGQFAEVVCDDDPQYDKGDVVQIDRIDYKDLNLPYAVVSEHKKSEWWMAINDLKPIS